MKITLLAYALVASLAASAQAALVSPIKTCSTILSAPDSWKSVPTNVEIFSNGNSFVAKVTQTTDGQTNSYNDIAEISWNKVRAGLNANSINKGDLNLAESLVAHAMMLTEDPVFRGAFNAGLDLKVVRSAKVYQIGKASNMGITAIVETKDELGKDLGSFFGGFLVSACK